MSFNGSGTWIAPAGQPVVSGTVISSATFNALVGDIGSTYNNVLPRDGQAPMTATLKIIDGTVTVPGLAFNSESSSGLFRPSTGNIAVTVSGVEGMRLNSGGRVLIGTTTDDGTTRLQVSGNATVSGTLGVTGAFTSNSFTSSGATITGGSINGTPIGATTASTGAFTTLASSGSASFSSNVGISSAPSSIAKLIVGGGVYVTGPATLPASIGSGLFSLEAPVLREYIGDGTGYSRTFSKRVSSATTDLVTIQDGGNVGIGVTPSAKLHVNGDMQLNTTSQTIYSNNFGAVSSAAPFKFLSNSNVQWQTTGGTVWLTLDTTGTLGLGVTPSAWGGSYRALEMANGCGLNAYTGGVDSMSVHSNMYYNGTSCVRKITDYAGQYSIQSGAHYWMNAPTGAAGTTFSFTTAMMLDTSGNLLVGSTSSSWGSAGRGLVEINGSSNALLGLKINGTQGGYFQHDGTNLNLVSNTAGALQLGTNSAIRMTISSAGVIADSAGNELGYKGLPQTNQAAAYTLVASDRGKHIYQRSAAAVTVPAGVFSVGDAVTVVNGTNGTISLTQGTSVTLQQAGTTNTGSRTILANGICTLICVSANVFYVSGNIS